MVEKNESAEKEPKDLVEVAKASLIFLTPYSVFVGCLYLTGYWMTFNVNIFQFAGISDVVGSAFLPLLFAIITMMLGCTIGTLFGLKRGVLVGKKYRLRRSSQDFVDKHLALFATAYIIFCVVIGLSDWAYKWPIFSALATLPMMSYLLAKEFVLPDLAMRDRILIVFALVFMLPMAYGVGSDAGRHIKSGDRYFYVVSSGEPKIAPKNLTPQTALRFIGHVGEYDFFYDPVADAVTIEKIQKDNFLTVHEYTGEGWVSFSGLWRKFLQIFK